MGADSLVKIFVFFTNSWYECLHDKGVAGNFFFFFPIFTQQPQLALVLNQLTLVVNTMHEFITLAQIAFTGINRVIVARLGVFDGEPGGEEILWMALLRLILEEFSSQPLNRLEHISSGFQILRC